MRALNVVRFRVKAGHEDAFVDYHRRLRPNLKGFLGGSVVRTGEQTFCVVGEWRSFDHLASARPQMIEILDGFREMLEDLGGDLGVTDPVSGEVVTKLKTAKKGKPKRGGKKSGKDKASKGKSGRAKAASGAKKKAKKK